MATPLYLDQIYERVVKGLWRGRTPLVVSVSALNTSSSATSLVVDQGPATALYDATYSSASANAYDGVGVFMTAPNTGTPTAPEGQYGGRVTRGGFAGSSGTYTISPGFSTDPNIAPSTIPNILFLYGLHIEEIFEGVQEVLRGTYLPRYLPLTLVTDGDMETSGVANWVDVNGTPTQTKETSIVLTGKQSLKIVTTTVDHSLRSASIPVTEGRNYFFWSPIKCTAGSLRAQIYDVTNAAEVHGATVDEEAWTEVRFQFTVPNNCQNIQVRYIAKTASTTAYVDHAGVLSQSTDIVACPSQVVYANDIEGVYYLPQGMASEAVDSYEALTEALEPWDSFRPLQDYAGVNAQRIEVTQPGNNPLFIKFNTKDSTFSGYNADRDEYTIDPDDLVVPAVIGELATTLMHRPRNARDQQRYAALARQNVRRYNESLEADGLGRPRVHLRPARRVVV